MDIIVAGAGIFGVTAALELRRRGHSVSLLDPGPLPHADASSTDISKAIRMDYGADEAYTDLMEVAFNGWDAWNRDWERPLYHESGIVFMAREAMHAGQFEGDSFALLEKRGHSPQRITPDVLAERYPMWNADSYTDGYFNPLAGWAESGRVVARLIEQCRAEGVALREGVAFERLHEEGSRVAGVVTRDGETLHAEAVVVAAGAWTPTLLPHLAEVMWAVGQPVLHFRVDDPAAWQPPHFPVWGADISHSGWYGFPALEDGTLKVGHHGAGVRVHPGEPRVVPDEWEARFRAFLRETFPALADAPRIGQRLCLYCDTWDGDFWIGRDPEREGLVVATGGSGHGFKFAPVMGGLVADALEGEPNAWSDKFAWRARGTLAKEDARYEG